MTEIENKTLFGVDYPTRVRKPGQPPRPMTHTERNIFRRKISDARKREERAGNAVLRAEMKALNDVDLMVLVNQVKTAVKDKGYIHRDFTKRFKVAMHEANSRGTVFIFYDLFLSV